MNPLILDPAMAAVVQLKRIADALERLAGPQAGDTVFTGGYDRGRPPEAPPGFVAVPGGAPGVWRFEPIKEEIIDKG